MAKRTQQRRPALSPASPEAASATADASQANVSAELVRLRKRQLETRLEFDGCYEEWNDLEALAEGKDANFAAADRARLAKKRDDAAALFDAATAAFETARDEFLADPNTRAAAEAELAEIDKREAYQSTQARGKGTTGGQGNREFIRYRLKKSEVVTVSGKGNPVYYPETALDGCITPKQLLNFLAADGSALSPAAIAAVAARIESELLKLLRANHSVNLFNLFVVSPTLRGTCTEAETDAYFHRSFTPYLSVRATPKFLREFRCGLGARKIAGPARNVYIGQILVPTPKGLFETVEPPARSYLRIRGKGIKYNSEAPDEGVFFIVQQTGKAVQLPRIGFPDDITSGTINCRLPDELLPGTQGHLVLRIRKANSARLSEEQYPVLVTIAAQSA